jgi:hypothetical protein
VAVQQQQGAGRRAPDLWHAELNRAFSPHCGGLGSKQ